MTEPTTARECDDLCVTAADLGLPEYGGIAYPHACCPAHGSGGPCNHPSCANNPAVEGYNAWGWPDPWHETRANGGWCWKCQQRCSRDEPCDCCCEVTP